MIKYIIALIQVFYNIFDIKYILIFVVWAVTAWSTRKGRLGALKFCGER